MASLLLRHATLIDATGRRRADLLIRDGRIAAIGPDISFASDAQVIDCSGKLVSEGFTDIHVHFREPGQSYKETIRTGSLAAAHGGYTTVCAMPNLNPSPTARRRWPWNRRSSTATPASASSPTPPSPAAARAWN